MTKITSYKYATKDDPIFSGRYKISNPKVPIKKPIKVEKENLVTVYKENLKETDPFFDGVKELKRKEEIFKF